MNQRAAERQSAQFTAHCVSLGRCADARLLNVSQNGCLVELSEPILTEGSPVRLRIPGLSSLDGKVMWSEDVRAGVSFAMDLHPAVVDYIAGCLNEETAERLGVAPAGAAR